MSSKRPIGSNGIKTLGNPVLREVVPEVEEITNEVLSVISRMKFALTMAKGYAIAANQIGVAKRIFVYNIDNQLKTIINPVLGEYDNEYWFFEEGCLSIPGFFFPIWRPKHVIVRGVDEKGNDVKLHATDILGRIFQHETDHLNGRLVIDHLSPQEQKEFFEQWKK